MEFNELQLNRFGYKSNQSVETADSEQLASNNSGTVSNPSSSISQPKDNSKNSRNLQTATVITSCFIQTTALPNRVEISGNDARFYDDSVGGTGQLNGDPSSIKFIRADQYDGTFIMQKRHGINNNFDNVFEMYYTELASNSRLNYIFIGRSGVATTSSSFTDIIVNHALNEWRVEIARVNDFVRRPTISSSDLNKLNPSLFGVQSYIAGEGKDGQAGIGKLIEILSFSSPTSFAVGDTITGNSTGATALLIYKVNASLFYADHTNSLTFNPSTDNACTTNGAGGGSGTGNLSSNEFGPWISISVDKDLKIQVDGQVVVNESNGGRMSVSAVTDAGPMTNTKGTQRDIVFNTSNNKFYGCTVTGNPATWVALN